MREYSLIPYQEPVSLGPRAPSDYRGYNGERLLSKGCWGMLYYSHVRKGINHALHAR